MFVQDSLLRYMEQNTTDGPKGPRLSGPKVEEWIATALQSATLGIVQQHYSMFICQCDCSSGLCRVSSALEHIPSYKHNTVVAPEQAYCICYANCLVIDDLENGNVVVQADQCSMMQTVEPKGPANQAGFLGTRRSLGGVVAGDSILSMNGKRIQSAADVDACLDNLSIGDTVNITLRRATNGVRCFSCFRCTNVFVSRCCTHKIYPPSINSSICSVTTKAT